MVGIGVETTRAALSQSERQRTASSPVKLPVVRVKDKREDARARECEQLVAHETEQRQQHRALRFHGRWPHVRAFYATVAAHVPDAKRKIWLRRVAAQLHDTIVGSTATVAQTESAVTSALHALIPSPSDWRDVLQALRCAMEAFHRDEALVFDYREFLCACIVLDRWQDGEVRMLTLWMDEYSLPVPPVGEMAIQTTELPRVLLTPCAGTVDEQTMAPHIAELLHLASKTTNTVRHRWVRVADIQRVVDDMRLGFFRDIYSQAIKRVNTEEAHCRVVMAMQLWQLREPRARLARWKAYVHVQKLHRRGDAFFLTIARIKTVARFRQNRAHRQQLSRWLATAKAAHEASLVRWTLHAWRLCRASMRDIHRSAWRRSERHHAVALLTRVWQAYAVFVEAGRAERTMRQALLNQFVTHRHMNVLRYSWSEWMFVYRRQKEVRAAMHLQRELHGNIEAQRREAAEYMRMAVEDELSQALKTRQRQLAEQARRRALQEATDRVYANRKLQQQQDERTQFKKARQEHAAAEMEEAWTRISERVATEVRAATIAWFRSSEGHKAVHAEATTIFEHDPVVLQTALLRDPQAFALPGCRWQLRLEDYGGRFAKAFFLNTETLEKFVCDELVMDNCETIAREVLIQRRIDDARARLRAKADVVQRERERQDAAIRIQMLFRGRHALLLARSKIRATIVKRIEPSSGNVVYFNVAKQETRHRPPRLMGSDEPLLPVESSTWVRRIDDDGKNYYLHQETGETSWTPPPHHFMCVQCKLNLATRRWNETGARWCIVCYADGLARQQFGTAATWTKLSVQPAKCVVCRQSAVEVVCHECRGDATCVRCCQAVHRSAKLAAHSDMEYVVYS